MLSLPVPPELRAKVAAYEDAVGLGLMRRIAPVRMERPCSVPGDAINYAILAVEVREGLRR